MCYTIEGQLDSPTRIIIPLPQIPPLICDPTSLRSIIFLTLSQSPGSHALPLTPKPPRLHPHSTFLPPGNLLLEHPELDSRHAKHLLVSLRTAEAVSSREVIFPTCVKQNWILKRKSPGESERMEEKGERGRQRCPPALQDGTGTCPSKAWRE